MRLKPPSLSALVSFLLGAGWGLAVIGALSSFFAFVHASLFLGFLGMIFGAIPGLLLVVAMEYLLLKSDVHAQLKHQTRLLEQIERHLRS
jgi:ABC-type lipoprotein release transport system permease subunit